MNRGNIILSVLAITLALFPLVGCAPQKEELQTETSPIEITAEKLYIEYEEQQLAADTEYKDRTLRVSGKIYTFGKTTSIIGLSQKEELPYLILDGGRAESSIPGLLDIWGTQCIFPAGSTAVLAKLAKGDEVVVEGKCIGGQMRFVVLTDCYLISISK